MENRRPSPTVANSPNNAIEAPRNVRFRKNRIVMVCFCMGSSTSQNRWNHHAAGITNAATISAPTSGQIPRAIDSDAADVKNIAGDRAAGSIIGAQFLKRFVNNVPWAHLDIAGVAWSKKDKDTVPKGATAFGVRLLDRLVAAHYEGK